MLSHSLRTDQTLTRKRGFQHRLAALGETKANHLPQSIRGANSESPSPIGRLGTARDSFPAAGLGFARFFFPLLKPVLGTFGQPTIRQQSLQGSRVAWGDDRNPTQHVG